MKSKLNNFIVISVLLFSITLTNSVSASSIKDLEAKQESIKNSMSETNRKIEEKTATLADINAEIEKLDTELINATEELSKINIQLDTVTEELNLAKDNLVIATLEKEAQQETLEKRIKYMYEYGEVSYLDTILSSKSFSDLINRVEYLNVIHEFDQNMYENLEKKEAEIQEYVLIVDQKKNETEILQKSATQKRDELQANVNQKMALNEKIKTDVNLLAKQIEEKEQASRDIENMIQAEIKRQEELARQNNSVANTTYNGGKLMWPTDSTYITSHYGYRTHPISGKPTTLHAGTDVGVSVGTNVYSAESGSVLTSGWVSGYGNTVIIMHDNGLTTLYAHLSKTLVSVGQRVNRGDLVALSGNTGNSTGPHLHFEVRLNGSAVDAMSYVQ